jgi:hypothetical protein
VRLPPGSSPLHVITVSVQSGDILITH